MHVGHLIAGDSGRCASGTLSPRTAGDAQHIANFTTLPELLKREGYATHAIGAVNNVSHTTRGRCSALPTASTWAGAGAAPAAGKWDVGYVVAATTPTYKGFDTFLGYYRACNNDLFYHSTSPCEKARCAALRASEQCCSESKTILRCNG